MDQYNKQEEKTFNDFHVSGGVREKNPLLSNLVLVFCTPHLRRMVAVLATLDAVKIVTFTYIAHSLTRGHAKSSSHKNHCPTLRPMHIRQLKMSV